MVEKKTILITGGAGFIGSHVVRHFVNQYPDYRVVNLDLLTYAGNLENLRDVEGKSNYSFVKGDISDPAFLDQLFEANDFSGIIHLAAESHVDRSIADPMAFIRTNIIGTVELLNACRRHWKDFGGKRFYHVSTDEVYGSLGETGFFTETTPYDPRSPYSASKASSDFLVRAYHHTYGLPVVLSNCSNNYGPYQFPEKLIPAHHPQYPPEQAPADLRRRKIHPRLALGPGPCQRHRRGLPPRRSGRDLQYRREQRMEEHRPGPPALRYGG